MRLRRKYNEHVSPPTTNFLQVGYRSEAIGYAFEGITRQHKAFLEAVGDKDPLAREFDAVMQEWVGETLIQGAYLREYHLWEKDCRAYFDEMAKRDGGSVRMKAKKDETFVDLITIALAQFDVTLSSDIMPTIDAMRKQVNIMKHVAGLDLEHFVTKADYDTAIDALEKFWSEVASAENIEM